MNGTIRIFLAVEDALSETVARVILEQSGRKYVVDAVYGRRGFGDLKRMAPGFNKTAAFYPILLITDLDRGDCAPGLIADWIRMPVHQNLIFRVAVREIESWIMAHRAAFAELLGISRMVVPLKPDELPDPKNELLRLAARSRRRRLKDDLLSPADSTRHQGPGYNTCLESFVRRSWRVAEAARYSPSLAQAWNRIREFTPQSPSPSHEDM